MMHLVHLHSTDVLETAFATPALRGDVFVFDFPSTVRDAAAIDESNSSIQYPMALRSPFVELLLLLFHVRLYFSTFHLQSLFALHALSVDAYVLGWQVKLLLVGLAGLPVVMHHVYMVVEALVFVGFVVGSVAAAVFEMFDAKAWRCHHLRHCHRDHREVVVFSVRCCGNRPL